MPTRNRSVVIAVVVVLVLAIGAFVYLTPPATAPTPQDDLTGGNPPAATSTPNTPGVPVVTPPATTTQPKPPASSGITMAEVAMHASAASCWTVIRGSVYNLTTWIAQHPGGQAAILQLCGKDGTNEFVGQHGGSTRQETMLATFKIGVLAQ